MSHSDDRITVRSAYADRPTSVTFMGLSLAAFLGLILVLGTAFLFMSLWWFKWRVNTEADIRRDGFDFQVSAEDRVLDLNTDLKNIDVQIATPGISAEQVTQLKAQRKAIATDLCDTAARVNNPKPTVADIIAVEC